MGRPAAARVTGGDICPPLIRLPPRTKGLGRLLLVKRVLRGGGRASPSLFPGLP